MLVLLLLTPLLTLHRSEAPQESCKEVPSRSMVGDLVEDPDTGRSVEPALVAAEEPLVGPSEEPLAVEPLA